MEAVQLHDLQNAVDQIHTVDLFGKSAFLGIAYKLFDSSICIHDFIVRFYAFFFHYIKQWAVCQEKSMHFSKKEPDRVLLMIKFIFVSIEKIVVCPHSRKLGPFSYRNGADVQIVDQGIP